MTQEFLEKVASELECLEGFAIVYMTLAEKKKVIPIQLTHTNWSTEKKVDFSLLARVTEENINQAFVVKSNIKGLDPMKLVYLSHRYYAVPILHRSIILHRIQLSDVVAIVKCDDIEHKLNIDPDNGLGRDWKDEGIELTRKDVKT